jgi:hypothetical protein
VNRLLTFNCHEAWVHQLGALGAQVDVVDGLPGRYTRHWDECMRPVPKNLRLISIEAALNGDRAYDCIIGHNLSDLMCVKTLDAPRLLVLHVTLEHRLTHSGAGLDPAALQATIREYLRRVGGHVVAVTQAKRESWNLGGDVVESAVDIASYPAPTREVAAGVRIANQISARKQYLLWDFHQAAFAEIPVRIVGHNPDKPGVEASRSWGDLKQILRRHRFFIHTADPELEDGFNMALMEAAAAGLPILGNRHPTSPLQHGVDGFLSDDPAELAAFARRLLDDPQLAERMGRAAQELARKRFSPERFSAQLGAAMQRAHEAWMHARASRTAAGHVAGHR